MSYKNSMKLFASNFNFVWKQLVYLLCCLVLLAICSYTTIKPIFSLLAENGIGVEFEVLFKTIYDSPNEFALKLSDIFKNIIAIIANNFGEIYFSLFAAILLCLALPFVLIQLSVYNLSSIAHQKITMNKNSRYSQNAITTFKPALRYAFANIIFTLPFLLLNVAFIMLYVAVATDIISALIGLVILSAATMVLQSVKMAIFANYTGLVISEPQSMFKAFGKSFGVVFKNFWKNFSTSLVLYLTIIVVNSFILVFTFFAGLIVSIPATFVLMAFYYIVSYLNSVGQRYYLSDTIIYNPVKHVVKKDDFVTISIPDTSNEEQVETTSLKRVYKKHKN